ncbi:MAG: glycosyltransferase [Hahellaceae bacterium]|nr:glycosyltransferase [Hahellaceae bacterium]
MANILSNCLGGNEGNPACSRRIVFVLPSLGGGGAERVTLNFIGQLDLSRFKTYLLLFDGNCELESFIPPGVTIIHLDCGKAIKALFPIWRTLRKIKPNYVYGTHSRVVVLLSVVKFILPRFIMLTRVPNMPSIERLQGYTSSFFAKIFGWAYRRSDIVLVQTEAMNDDVIKEYGVISEKVYIAPNPLDKIVINSRLQNGHAPLTDGLINIVASGRHTRQKGFDVLIKSFYRIAGDIPSAHLYIIGREDEQTSSLVSLIHAFNLESRVHLLGFVENPYTWYKCAKLFVMSSRWEGFPNALLENYYLNKPIVATRCVPIVSELVIDGVNGYTVETDNEAMLATALLKALNQGFGEISNAPYEGFILESVLKEMEE